MAIKRALEQRGPQTAPSWNPLVRTRTQAVALILVLDLMGCDGRSVESIDLLGRNRVFW